MGLWSWLVRLACGESSLTATTMPEDEESVLRLLYAASVFDEG